MANQSVVCRILRASPWEGKGGSILQSCQLLSQYRATKVPLNLSKLCAHTLTFNPNELVTQHLSFLRFPLNCLDLARQDEEVCHICQKSITEDLSTHKRFSDMACSSTIEEKEKSDWLKKSLIHSDPDYVQDALR